jgi:hypothetical protein
VLVVAIPAPVVSILPHHSYTTTKNVYKRSYSSNLFGVSVPPILSVPPQTLVKPRYFREFAHKC